MVLCLPTPTAHGLSTSTELLIGHVSVGMRAQEVTAAQEKRVERGRDRSEPTYVRCTQLRAICTGAQRTYPRDSRRVPYEI